MKAARDWADDKTGRKASTAWKAASKERGFRARSKAASRAVRKKGGGRITSGIVGVIAAAFAGLAALFRRKPDTEKADQHDGRAKKEPNPAQEERPAYATGQSDADPRTRDERTATGDAPESSPNTSSPTTNTATPTTGGTTMAGLPAANIAADMAGAMSRYEPADAWQVLRDVKQWPDVPVQVAWSVKAYADCLESARFPLNPAIVSKLREMFEALSAVHDVAEELEPLMRRAHAADLARGEARRGDERKWNV